MALIGVTLIYAAELDQDEAEDRLLTMASENEMELTGASDDFSVLKVFTFEAGWGYDELQNLLRHLDAEMLGPTGGATKEGTEKLAEAFYEFQERQGAPPWKERDAEAREVYRERARGLLAYLRLGLYS